MPDTDPSTDDPKESKRRVLRSRAGIFALVLAIIGGVTGGLVTFLLADKQEVRAQQGVEDDHKEQDSQTIPLRVENVYPTGTSSMATNDIVELAGQPYEGVSAALAHHAAVPVGEALSDEPSQVSQPTVHTIIGFTLVGQHYAPVQVVEMTARVVSHSEPPDGTLVYVQLEGGGVAFKLGFDLDSPDLNARVLGDVRATIERYFLHNYIFLARDERVEMAVDVFATKCACEFVIDIKTSDGRTITADNNGKPWMLSGYSPRYSKAVLPYVLTGGHDYRSCSWPAECRDYYTVHTN